MKFNLRWQLFLAIISFGSILMLSSCQNKTEESAPTALSANLCTTRVPAAGGIFAEGIVGAPHMLNPLLSDNYPVDQELVSLLFDGLTRYDQSGRLIPNLAESWAVSEDGLSLQFQLRQDILWHDGEPFSADDVLFTYQLLQDEAFPGPPTLKKLWQAVTVNKLGPYSLEIVLSEPYTPFLEATTRGILPAHSLEGVTAVTLPASSFNHTPIGTGPFMVGPGQSWEKEHRLRLTPNPAYWQEGTPINTLEFRFYPDETALSKAFAAGNIQAVNKVSQAMLPTIAAQPGTRLFTAAEPHHTAILFNLTDSAAPAVQSPDVRRALAYALDREALVDEELNGQGLPLEGPYLPNSWAYTPSLLTTYTYNPITATVLLDTAGWTLPEGTTTRFNEAITTTLQIRLLTLDKPPHPAIAQNIADQWAGVGVAAEVILADSIEALRELLAARDFDAALVDIAASGDPDLYDFWSQEAIVRGQNYSGWDNRRASEALENGRKIWPVDDRRPYYATFLRHYNNDLPAITLYQHTYTYALSQNVHEAAIGQITQPRDRYQTFADWFLHYRDEPTHCPDESN